MKKKDLVSIIITSKNEEDVIERLLKSITGQTFKNIEIILVDNNSTDNTLKVAADFKQLKIFNKGPERSAQRNYGAKKSRGNFLFFLDSDMALSAKVIEECLSKVAQNKKIGALIVPEESVCHSFWEKVKGFERSFYNEGGDSLIEAARFFRREAYIKAGGYDETITGPEDWDLAENVKEISFSIGRIKSNIYHYERIPSLGALIKKKYYYALKSSTYLSKNKISVFSPKTVYFLRPSLYANWRKIISHPILYLAMMIMLLLEQISGGLGYFTGKYFQSEEGVDS